MLGEGKKCKIMKRTNYTLYDNYNVNEEDYRESWEENGSVGELWDYAMGSINLDWEDLCGNMEFSPVCQESCIITGRLGLWNGRPTIEPVVCKSVWEAIKTCIERSIDYVIIKKVNGHLTVEAIHHDGANYFEIHRLNDKGINAGDNADLSNRCYHKAYPERLF